MKAFKYVFVAGLAVFVAAFFIFFINENDDRVRLCISNYCTKEGFLSGYVLISFLFGMIFSALLSALPLLKFKASKMSLQKQIKKYEKEIQTLRNQPLDDLPQNPSVAVAKLVEEEEKTPPHLLQSP